MNNTNLHLTHREIEIMEALSIGLQDKEIAGKNFIAVETVKKHISNIYKKIGVRNRVEAAIKYRFGELATS